MMKSIWLIELLKALVILTANIHIHSIKAGVLKIEPNQFVVQTIKKRIEDRFIIYHKKKSDRLS